MRSQSRATTFIVALCLLLVGGVTLLGAAQRTTAWSSAGNQVAVLGGTSDEVVNGIAVDGSGNVLLTGSFRGTADFDPGSGTESITSLGSDDVFVVKLNSSGQLVWAKSV